MELNYQKSYLLMTFCNVSYLPKQHFLGVYNWVERRLQYVSLTFAQEGNSTFYRGVGATGIVKVNNGYVITTQSSTCPHIIYLDTNLNVVCCKALEMARDPHSIAYNEDFLYITSTSNNSIIKLPFNNQFGEEQVHWTFENNQEDIIHLNGIAFVKDELIISCFGKQVDNKTIRGGFVKNISSNEILLEGIREPHNLTCYQDKLYVVESTTGCIYKIDEDGYEIVKEFAGYARGLAFSDQDDIFIVRNARRKSSRHIGNKKTVPLKDITNNICEWQHSWICHSKWNQTTYQKQDITAFAFEVYDLIVLDYNFQSPNLIDFDEGINQRILSYENLCSDLKNKLNKTQKELEDIKQLLNEVRATTSKKSTKSKQEISDN